jgi:hypothetical protein
MNLLPLADVKKIQSTRNVTEAQQFVTLVVAILGRLCGNIPGE